MGRPSAYSSLVSKGPTNNAGAPTNIISWQDRLDRFLILGADGGNTNCGALMSRALRDQRKVDVFVVITDNEHNQGEDPMAVLRRYREQMGIPDAKLVVIALTATEYSIGSTEDAGVLNIAGFDPIAPTIIRSFCVGDSETGGVEEDRDGDE